MKNIEIFLKTVLVLVFTIGFVSCKKEKKEVVEPKIMSDTTATTTVVEFEPFKIIGIKHKVADYEKWRKVYDAHDSTRTAYGITHYMIGRGIDEPNMIIIMDKMNDVQKAKDFSKLPNLKETMKKGGVIGTPEFTYYDVIRNEPTPIDQKERLMVTHRVKDFDAWLKVYDAEGTAKRMDEGLIDRGMARGIDDPNMVSVVFAITDMKKAKDNINSEAKKKLMKEAGVEGTPQMFFYKLVD